MTTVRRLGWDEYGFWDAFVAQSPQGSLYATSAYLAVLGFPFEIWVVDDGAIQAGIPLVRNEVGHLANPLFAKYLGILVRPLEGAASTRTSLFIRLVETLLTGLPTVSTFDYTHHPSFDNWLPYYWRGFQQESRYTYGRRSGATSKRSSHTATPKCAGGSERLARTGSLSLRRAARRICADV